MKEKLKHIKMILMDVDGVMTGGEIIYCVER
jgi:3-deoxy-D-manno-octulosonate 8-phosphate phosphatase KdsC-like HAD superfamily phosphatase